ncbi:MAG: HupE/UreJ family protein [Roseobacter sp.]|jgi:hypothetical protein|nr:HupE/UreJ family protein [Roseobacter sp.]
MRVKRSAVGTRSKRVRQSGRHLVQLAIMIAFAAAPMLIPTTAVAHDAFGDLGPFYESMLHPLADPLQAAVLVGTAAFLAGRPLLVVRRAMPMFILVAGIGSVAVFSGKIIATPPVLAGLAALLVGLAATLPENWTPRPVVHAIAATMGFFVGLAPGTPDEGLTLQTLMGSFFGISVLVTLLWYALEAAARRLTRLAPKVVGTWVAAVGILVIAFSASASEIL